VYAAKQSKAKQRLEAESASRGCLSGLGLGRAGGLVKGEMGGGSARGCSEASGWLCFQCWLEGPSTAQTTATICVLQCTVLCKGKDCRVSSLMKLVLMRLANALDASFSIRASQQKHTQASSRRASVLIHWRTHEYEQHGYVHYTEPVMSESSVI
jgi:hypothetical protein